MLMNGEIDIRIGSVVLFSAPLLLLLYALLFLFCFSATPRRRFSFSRRHIFPLFFSQYHSGSEAFDKASLKRHTEEEKNARFVLFHHHACLENGRLFSVVSRRRKCAVRQKV